MRHDYLSGADLMDRLRTAPPAHGPRRLRPLSDAGSSPPPSPFPPYGSTLSARSGDGGASSPLPSSGGLAPSLGGLAPAASRHAEPHLTLHVSVDVDADGPVVRTQIGL